MAAALPTKNKHTLKKAGIVIIDDTKTKSKYYLGQSGGDLYLKNYSKWHKATNNEERLYLLQVAILKQITKIYNFDALIKYLKETYNLEIASDGWVKNSENLPDKYKESFMKLIIGSRNKVHLTSEGKLRILNPHIKRNPPKGNCEEQDSDMIDCAIREFNEEIGIEIPRELLTDTRTKVIKGYNITYYVISKAMYDEYGLPKLPIGDIPTSELFDINWYSLSSASNTFQKMIEKKDTKFRRGGTRKRKTTKRRRKTTKRRKNRKRKTTKRRRKNN